MRMRLIGTMAACLSISALATAQEPLPVHAAWFPEPVQQEMPLLIPPVRSIESTPAPYCKSCDDEKAAKGFDKNRLYLPESNPGERQPPCPCMPLGKLWLDAAYLYGTTKQDGEAETEFRSGLKVNAGGWLDRCQNVGVQASFFFLNGGDDTLLPAIPFANALAIRDKTSVWGANVEFRRNLFCEDDRRHDLLIGYRYLNLGDKFSAGPATLETANNMHLAQIGWTGEYRTGSLYADLTGKIGLGVNTQGADGIVFGGVAADGTRSRFVAVPEAEAKVGYQWSDMLRAFVGYQFLYANDVVRPRSLFRGTANGDPRATSDFWMQAIQVGVEARF